jgi:hypothetical protein
MALLLFLSTMLLVFEKEAASRVCTNITKEAADVLTDDAELKAKLWTHSPKSGDLVCTKFFSARCFSFSEAIS